MKSIVLLAIIGLMCSSQFLIQAQEVTINTDRPDITNGVTTVPFKKFQIENGIYAAKETVLNNLMLRFGISHTTELRLMADAGREQGASGLKPLTISVKQRLLTQEEFIPAISLIADLSLGDCASSDFTDDEYPVNILAAFENQLSQKFSLGYNIGTSHTFDNLDLSLSLSCQVTERTSTFAEYASNLNDEHNNHYAVFGGLFLINSRLQADIAMGKALSDTTPGFFTTIGISYLFH